MAYGQRKCFLQFRGLGNPVANYGRFRVCAAYFLVDVFISLPPWGQRNNWLRGNGRFSSRVQRAWTIVSGSFSFALWDTEQDTVREDCGGNGSSQGS